MEFKLFNGEVENLVCLLTNNNWLYHSDSTVKESNIRYAVVNGYYSDERETFWIIDGNEKVGIIIINDINDTIPLFDIRLDAAYRGKGYGVKSLKWLKNYLFGEKEKIRIEGYTRADNVAMRKCFISAGFVKEGYLRNAWENSNGTIYDTVLYAAILDDWQTGNITLSKINDEPY